MFKNLLDWAISSEESKDQINVQRLVERRRVQVNSKWQPHENVKIQSRLLAKAREWINDPRKIIGLI